MTKSKGKAQISPYITLDTEQKKHTWHSCKLEDLMVLKRSPDLLNNVKIGQDQLQLIMKCIFFYGGCGHFGQVT